MYTLPHSVPLTLQQATVDPYLHRRCLDTHRRVWLSLLLGHRGTVTFSWCTQGIVCALQESVSPVLWKVCNQIPLPSEVNFPEGSQSLCQIPRSGNMLEYYSAIKRNTFESVLMRLMNLEPIIQSEVRQKEKDIYLYSNAYIYRI